MIIIMRMSQGKGIVDDTGLVNTATRTQEVTKGLTYNPYHPVSHAMPETSTP